MRTPEKKAKHAAYMRRWTAKNKEKVKAISKKQWERHGKKYAQRRVERYEANPELKIKAVARATAWRLANPEKYKANMAAAAIRNAIHRRAKVAAWRKNNPERVKANALEGQHRRRARINGNGPKDPRCRIFVRVVKLIARYYCPYCGKWHQGVPTIDHVVSLRRGGRHELENLALACGRCNSAKGDRPAAPFFVRRN